MSKRKHPDWDEDDPPPSFLKIRLPSDYRALLPDLLLLDVPRVDYVQANGKSATYLYRVVSLVLDQPEGQIRLYTTPSGTDVADADDSWKLVPNNDEEYKGGIFLCKPCPGKSIYCIADFLKPQNYMG